MGRAHRGGLTDSSDAPGDKERASLAEKVGAVTLRNGAWLAVAVPLVLVSFLPTGAYQLLLLAGIFLVEAVTYLTFRRQSAAASRAPRPFAQAGWGCLAVLLLLTAILVAASQPAVAVGLSLAGLAILVLVGRRVRRASRRG